jgi:hypothetical protein
MQRLLMSQRNGGCTRLTSAYYTVPSFVRKFCKGVRDSLEDLGDNDFFTAIYIGETIQTMVQRMRMNYPIHFYEWFGSPTYIFKIAQLLENMTPKETIKNGTLAREGFFATLLHSLMDDFNTHSQNDAFCGYRPDFGHATAS